MEVKTIKAIDIFARPWAISADGLESIITAQNEIDYSALMAKPGEWSSEGANIIMRDSVAILPITGPIIRHGSFLSMFFQMTSLSVLAKDFKTVLDSDKVKSVILDIDSPGGQVSGVNEFAEMVYEARGTKPITAYVGGTGSSAAYWIASAADKIIIDATASLGSIGCVVAMWKQSGDRIEIVSTQSPNKRPDPDSAEGRKEILKTADAIADQFIKSVARNRGTETDTVINDFGHGGVLVGDTAVRAGMADGLGNLETLILQANQKFNQRSNIMATREELKTNFKQIVAEAPDLLDKFKTEAEHKGHESGVKEGIATERKRVTEILGADADPVETKKAIEDGTEAEAAYKQFYTAEREKRALGLKAMEKESTTAMGQEELDDKELTKQGGEKEAPIDQQLVAKANKLAEEKGISFGEASKQIAATENQLRSKWRPAGTA